MVAPEACDAKDLEDGTKAVGFFNVSETNARVSVSWPELKSSGKCTVRDLWRQKNLGEFENRFEIAVAAHGAELFKLRSAK